MDQAKAYHDRPGASTDERVSFIGNRGFTQVENAVIYDSGLSVGARFAYTVLKSHMYNKDHCWPGMARLSDILGATEKTVRGYIRELEDAGLIHKRRRGQRDTNLYTLKSPTLTPESRPVNTTDPNRAFFTGSNPAKITAEEDEGEEQKENNKYSVGDGQNPSARKEDPKSGKNPKANPPKTTKPSRDEEPGRDISAKGLVSKLVSDLEASGHYLDDRQRGRYGSNFKALVSKGVPSTELHRVVARIVSEWPRYQLSPQQALSDLRGEGRGTGSKAPSKASPEKTPARGFREEPRRARKKFLLDGDDAARIRRMLEDSETEAGRLMRDLRDGTGEEVVTQRTVAVALSEAITGGKDQDWQFGGFVAEHLERAAA